MAMQILSKVMRKVFGTRNDRLIKAYHRRVGEISAFEPDIRKLDDSALREKTSELRQRIADGERPEAVMSEAFAVMREAMDRNVGIRNIFNPDFRDQFDVSKLPANVQQLYNQTLEKMEAAELEPVLGDTQPVPGWLRLEIPLPIYEAVREIYPKSRPPFRARPFDVQLIGGMVLYEGRIAEMKTGEGKTIVAPLACYMACIESMQCHVVTVNDYLVQRDRDWVFPAFNALGLHVGAIHPIHMQPADEKKAAYQCDIVYGTNSEFGFDYLRDNMETSLAGQRQKHRQFCIVDEIDSILIDEARTPLIISGPAHDDAPQYAHANKVAEQLVAMQRQANSQTAKKLKDDSFIAERAKLTRSPESAMEKVVDKFQDLGADYLDEKDAELIDHLQYFVVKREQKQAAMTAYGVEEAQKIVGTRFYVVGNDMGWDHLINNALRAHVVYEKDRDYVVQNGEVVIVDEFTGRLMVGRQWSNGLHQAVEAKEARHGVKIKQETQTLATITIQNFFKQYDRLAGMTGTAMTEATEFMEIYHLDAVSIPTNVPVIRDDRDDLIFLTEKAKWQNIIDDIKEHSEKGQPVLVGTTSVEKSQMLSQLMSKKYPFLEHEVLNAKQHEREASIVALAGRQHPDPRDGKGKRLLGNITIATNMAGRGTDIKLDDSVREAGGLHIVGTERHESRRIDNQLRGRAGRQGDPGSSRFFISMEDDLMKMFAGKTTMKALSMMGMGEDDAIEHRWITRSVERAQRKVEDRNFQIRKNLLEYDEVMDYQRNSFYGTRQMVLEGREIKPLIFQYIAETIEDAVGRYLDPDFVPEQVAEAVRVLMNVSIDPRKLRGEELEDLDQRIRSAAKAEVRSEIENSLGEYMSHEMDTEDWDTKGLSSWAMSRFQVDLKQSTIRESNPTDIAEQLTERAYEQIERKPLDALERFFDKQYALKELAAWVQKKFDFELDIDDLSERRLSKDDEQQAVAEHIYQKAVERYRERELHYPVQFAMEMTHGAQQQGEEAGAWAADQMTRWAKARYDLDLDAETIRNTEPQKLYEMLLDEARAWQGEKLDNWLDETLAIDDEATLRRTVAERFGIELGEEDLANRSTLRENLEERARGVLRAELTRLEQYVLLQILDQTWKDHLYAMDQLKDSIGLRGFGERDPKIEYKTEGSRMFQEMLQSVREKVTDLIYRARLTPNVQMRNRYAQQQASHETSASTGVRAAAMAGATATAEQQADQEAASRAGSGERAVTAPIKNTNERYGRNDPCPRGSGRKYKKCCNRRDGVCTGEGLAAGEG